MVCEDQQDDSEFVYAKAKIDEQIRAIVGGEIWSKSVTRRKPASTGEVSIIPRMRPFATIYWIPDAVEWETWTTVNPRK